MSSNIQTIDDSLKAIRSILHEGKPPLFKRIGVTKAVRLTTFESSDLNKKINFLKEDIANALETFALDLTKRGPRQQ